MELVSKITHEHPAVAKYRFLENQVFRIWKYFPLGFLFINRNFENGDEGTRINPHTLSSSPKHRVNSSINQILLRRVQTLQTLNMFFSDEMSVCKIIIRLILEVLRILKLNSFLSWNILLLYLWLSYTSEGSMLFF